MVSISDSAITDLGHDDPDESEGSEEATDHASRSTNTELPVAMNLSHARAAENHDVNGDLGLTMLVDLPNVPPFLSDDEAVEETSDDDYQPIIDEPSDLVPHPHFRATAYVGQEGGENGENHETDDEERESTEDKPDARERLEQQHVAQLLAGVDDTGSVEEEKLDNLRHDQFVPVDSGPAPGDLPNQSSRELDDHDLSKILVQLREQDDQEDALRRNGDTRDQGHPIESAGWSDQDLIHAQSQSPTENDIERDSPVFAVKYERSDARKSQAEKDLLISEFLSANVMELSTNFDKDIEKLDFDDIAASKARLAAHRRNGFINARKFLFETSFDPILIPAGAESADVGSIDVQLEGAALPPEPA
ncbi:MAG: hypothetical protein ORN98_03090, partial [Alphaproteobacteria bacterium]|nr:hypothetical protein [Alphaproteobacteria bacterium]